MACYRKGGCGPYEMRSCTDCPASKPEYANKYNEAVAAPKQIEVVCPVCGAHKIIDVEGLIK